MSSRIKSRKLAESNLKDRLRKKLASKQGPKKICLVMIVRNEAKNMVRILDSVKSIIDIISIVDTGSTDNTETVILEWSKENKITASVHHEPFRNFSHNRTHSVSIAKKTYPEADYFLLSDADFVWEVDVGNKFDKTLLVDHKYLIEQYNMSIRYWNVRLLSSKVDFMCEGTTHEYWTEVKNQNDYTGEIRSAKIKTLIIDDREDGGCKGDKFERDERLLREGLDDSNTPEYLQCRYKFYLAQTLKDSGRFLESIEWYEKRITHQGWGEEMYYSKFQIGFNYEQLGWKTKHCVKILEKKEIIPEEVEFLAKWNPANSEQSDLVKQAHNYFIEAGVNYLGAYKYRKSRGEAIYYLTRMYRLLGQNDLGLTYALIGAKIPYPKDDTLFIEEKCHTYLFDFEISIVAYYFDDKRDLGRQAIARLIQRDDLPKDILDIVVKNSRHYI